MQKIVLLIEKHLEMPTKWEKNYEEIDGLFCEQAVFNGAYMWKECAALSFLLEL